MDRLRALQYFVGAAEEGSFAGAARRLGVSVPAVHKLVAALEASLGVALFERSVRGLTLTASGRTYLDACQPLLAELQALDEVVGRSATRASGVLVVAAHPQLARHFLLPELPRFHDLCPDVQVDLRVINRLADVDAAPAEVFLLHGWPEAQDMVHQPLGHARSCIAAAPSYWARHGRPQHPRDLAQHPCVLMRNPAGILLDLWEFEREGAGGAERVEVQVGGWISSNAREATLDLVLAGHGVGRFNDLTTREPRLDGRLVPVLGDWAVRGGPPLNLLYRAAQRRTPRVRRFIDFVQLLLRELDDDGQQRGPVDLPRWHRRGSARASSILRWPG